MSLVVADAGPPHYLVLLGHVDVLPRLYGRVTVPAAVVGELTHPRAPQAVRSFFGSPPTWVAVVRDPEEAADVAQIELGLGERAALSLALALALASPGARLLCDDLPARRFAEARSLGVVGTLGILVEAATAGWLDLDDALRRLRDETNFRVTVALLAGARVTRYRGQATFSQPAGPDATV